MSLGPRLRRQWTQRRLRRRWLLGLGTLALSSVPLVGTLGYFSCLILSPVLSLVAVGVGVDGVRALRDSEHPAEQPAEQGAILWRLAGAGLRELGTLLALVLGILLLGMLWNRNCDPWGGMGFFVMGPVLSTLFGWIAGLWGGVLGKTRTKQILLGLTPFLFCLLVGTWRLYTQPVIFAFDPFWGWFSGGIYDESVAVGDRYIRFRAYNLLAASGFVLAFRAGITGPELRVTKPGTWPDRTRLGVAAVLLGLAALIGLRGSHYGFSATVESIDQRLALTHETEHFVIHYAPRSKTAREIEMVAAEHEFAWHRLATRLQREPEYPVHSFVFKDPDQKRGLFGAGKVEVSLPWKGHIYLHHLPFPHAVLHHELAHTFGGAFGDPVLGLSASGPNVNMGLVEGLANALAPRSSFNLDLHDQAAALDRLEKRPGLSGIMGLGFWAGSSSRAYTAAGSFVLWLLETEGVDPVVAVYRSGGDFEEAFGRSLEDLEQDWLTFIRARTLEEADIEAIRQRFKRRSLFRRPCAHRVAKLRKQIGRAKARGQHEEVLDQLQTLCEIESDRAEHRIALASARAELEDLEGARAELDHAAGMEQLTHALLATISERRGDVALSAGDLDTAREAYVQAATYSVDEGRLRTLQIKQLAAEDPKAVPEVLDYFQPFRPNRNSTGATVRRLYAAIRLSERDGWKRIGDYLVARQLLNFSQPSEAVPRLESALAAEALPSPELIRAARFALLNALVQTHDLDGAQTVLEQLEADPDATSGHRQSLQYWRERLDFYRGYFGGPSIRGSR